MNYREETIGVLLVTSDPTVARLVTTSMTGDARFGALTICRDLHDLVSRLERQPALAAVVDIDPQPKRVLAELEPLTGRFAETRFVLLSRQPDSDLLLEAMQIGARHLLSKSAVAAQLANVLGRLAFSGALHSGFQGRLYTVLSAAGGCGATTIAVNLASELHLSRPSQPALLVDLDTSTGGAGIALGARGDYGLADVLAHDGAADPQLVRSSVVACGNGVHLLLSPASVDFASAVPLPHEHLGRVMAACRMAYPSTVVDAPRVSMAAAAALGSVSQAVLIVLQLNVRDIRLTRQIQHALAEAGIPAERVHLLINRFQKRHCMIDLEEAQRALGRMNVTVLANDFAAASRGLNLGQPLVQAAPTSPLRKDIRGLLDRLAAVPEQPAALQHA